MINAVTRWTFLFIIVTTKTIFQQTLDWIKYSFEKKNTSKIEWSSLIYLGIDVLNISYTEAPSCENLKTNWTRFSVGLSVNFSWISCSYLLEMEAVAKIDMSLGKIVLWFILYNVYQRFTRIPMDSETAKSFSYF